MLHNRTEAKKLLNEKELAIFDAGRDDGLKRLDGREARAKLERARRLRDRYRQGDGNMAAKEKASVFDELVARFQKRLEHIATVERRAREGADRVTAARPKPARKPRRAGSAGAKTNLQTKGPGRQSRTASTARAQLEADKLQGDPMMPSVRPKSARSGRTAAMEQSEETKRHGDPIRVRLGRKLRP
jgi:hypothetical protein